MTRAKPLPVCRHRGPDVGNDLWECRSPDLYVPDGVVSGEVCLRECPVVDRAARDVSPPVLVRPARTLVAVAMTTAPRPARTVENSIAELRRGGFDQPVHVFEEPGVAVRPDEGVVISTNSQRLGLWGNWLAAARGLLDRSEAPFLLICQDDVDFAPCAALGLQHAIAVLPHEAWGYASLYTPRHNVEVADVPSGWSAAGLGRHGWGALSYCFTRESLEWLLANVGPPEHPERGLDRQVSETLDDARRRLWFHSPSLCSHAGAGISSLGHPPLKGSTALRFDHDYAGYVEDAAGILIDAGSVAHDRYCFDDPNCSDGLEARPTAPGSASPHTVAPGDFEARSDADVHHPLADHPSHARYREEIRAAVERELARRDVPLVAVTTYFNPCGYRNRLHNYFQFRAALRCPLVTLEVSFDGGFAVPDAIRINATDRNLMWQKERLLNLALAALPSEIQNVAWLDADLLFENPDWVEETVEKLEVFPVVQLFETFRRLDRHGRLNSSYRSVAASRLQVARPGFRGAPGGALAATRAALADGLFDQSIVGGGDTLAAVAWCGEWGHASLRSIPPEVRTDYGLWAARQFARVGGRFGFVSGNLLHLYHGSNANRKSRERHRILVDADFDPRSHLKHDSSGLWSWTEAASELRRQVASYFFNRREDERTDA